jgi:hypothetical protein
MTLRWAKPVLFAAILTVAGMRLWRGELAEVVTGAFAVSAIAVVFGATLILAVAAPADTLQAWLFGCSPLRFFGKHSYAIHVFHQAVALPLPVLGITAVSLSPFAGFALPGQLAFVASRYRPLGGRGTAELAAVLEAFPASQGPHRICCGRLGQPAFGGGDHGRSPHLIHA